MGTARQALEKALSASLGRPARIAAMDHLPVERSSHHINRLAVTLASGRAARACKARREAVGPASGERLSVIFKRLRAGHKVDGNEREVLIYRRILAGQRFGAPALYGSVYDRPRRRYWLFLEDVGERTLKSASRDYWLAAVRWLAQMHAVYLGREDELRAFRCLREHGPRYYRLIARRARENLRLAGAGRALAQFDAAMAPYESVVAELVRQPRTLVHGDVFAKNLMVQPGPRIRPIDWESAAIGLPAWDLARLLDGWGRDRPAFMALYLAEVERQAARPVDRRAFAAAFGHCDLLNILWHLGWEVDDCRRPTFVTSALEEMHTFWRRWRGDHTWPNGCG